MSLLPPETGRIFMLEVLKSVWILCSKYIQKGNENCYFGIIKGCSKLLLLRLLKGCTNPGQTNDKKIRKSCFRLPLLHVLGMNECQQNLAAF